MTLIIEGHDDSSESRLAALLAAAGDPTRLRILSLVKEQPRNVGEICRALQSAQPRVSHHLAILRRCGLLEVEVRGRQRIYRWPQDLPGSPEHELRRFLRRWLEERAETGLSSAAPQAQIPRSDELEDFLL